MCFWYTFEVLLGTIMHERYLKNSLICSGDGSEWISNSLNGFLFVAMHMFSIVYALKMPLRVFLVEVKINRASIQAE